MQQFANQEAHQLGHLKSLFDRRILAFVAPQGAGKQVISNMFCSVAPFQYLEAGAEVDDVPGLKAMKDQGIPIPNEKFLPLMEQAIHRKAQPYGGLIVDGAVRFSGQELVLHYAKQAGYTRGIYVVELFFSPQARNELLRRILQRGRCDDLNPEAVERRLRGYFDNLPTVQKMYRQAGAEIIQINGNQEHEVVFAQSLVNLCARMKNI